MADVAVVLPPPAAGSLNGHIRLRSPENLELDQPPRSRRRLNGPSPGTSADCPLEIADDSDSEWEDDEFFISGPRSRQTRSNNRRSVRGRTPTPGPSQARPRPQPRGAVPAVPVQFQNRSRPEQGALRAREAPFGFEVARERRMRELLPQSPPPVPPVAPRIPNMQLGGGLLHINRGVRRQEQPQDPEAARPSFMERLHGVFRRWDRAELFGHYPALGEQEGFLGAFIPLQGEFAEGNANLMEPPPAVYVKEYTHPKELPADYFPDFRRPEPPTVIDVDTGVEGPASTDEDESTDVCASCLAPLVTDSSDKNRRLWGLRCGHLLDGQCVQMLLKKAIEIKPSEAPIVSDSKGKGKGKGKEKAPPETLVEVIDLPPEVQREKAPVRYSLRSAATRGNAPASSSKLIPTLPKTRKSRAKPSPVEEYKWKCPVTNCGHEHTSIRVGDGPWRPHEDDGPILLYM